MKAIRSGVEMLVIMKAEAKADADVEHLETPNTLSAEETPSRSPSPEDGFFRISLYNTILPNSKKRVKNKFKEIHKEFMKMRWNVDGVQEVENKAAALVKLKTEHTEARVLRSLLPENLPSEMSFGELVDTL